MKKYQILSISTLILSFLASFFVNFFPTALVYAEEVAEDTTFETGCDKPGYYINPLSGKCKKINVCKTGYIYNATTNACDKILCPYGYKADASGKCHKFECDTGYILSGSTGKCVTNNSKDISSCSPGTAYDTSSKKCKPILPEDANVPECAAGEFLEKSSSGFSKHQIISPLDYENWLSRDLIVMNDSNTLDHGHFLDTQPDGTNTEIPLYPLTLGPLGIIAAKPDSSTGVDTTAIANIMSDEYAELRALITTYLSSQQEEDAPAAKTCAAGYFLNPDTNRCKKIPVTTVKTCPEGQYLNPSTNRCKNLTTVTRSSTSTTIKTYDPATGETTTTKICIEGYELNQKTNRCVKKKDNTGADYALDIPELGTIEQHPQIFIAITVAVTASVIGLFLAIAQFRSQIFRAFKKLFRRH